MYYKYYIYVIYIYIYMKYFFFVNIFPGVPKAGSSFYALYIVQFYDVYLKYASKAY